MFILWLLFILGSIVLEGSMEFQKPTLEPDCLYVNSSFNTSYVTFSKLSNLSMPQFPYL